MVVTSSVGTPMQDFKSLFQTPARAGGVDDDRVLPHEYPLVVISAARALTSIRRVEGPAVVSSASFKHLEMVMDLHYVLV